MMESGMVAVLRHGLRWLAALLLAVGIGTMASAEMPDNGPLPQVRISRNVPIATRDGTTLSGVLYRAEGVDTPLPTILAMTPYMADSWHDRAMFFARHGYVFLVVDHRGRGNSDGRFRPWQDDGRDGFDTVGWIAEQPWSDGQVGMIGGSYAGRNQWATLQQRPKALKTITPSASPYIGHDHPAYKNIFDAWQINWFEGVYGRTQDGKLRDDYANRFTPIVRANYLAGRAFAELTAALGMTTPVIDGWLARPSLDASWRALRPEAQDFAGFDIPILTITGQFDGVQRGALEHYRRHIAAGGPGAPNHYVLIGPWNHSGTRRPVAKVGGLDVGEASVIDIDRLHLAWFDWTMKHGERPAFLADKVTYYVTGANEWRHAATLDALGTREERLELAGPGGESAAQPATLVANGKSAKPLSYTYDPRDLRYGRDEPSYAPEVLLDTYPADHLYGAGIVYQSAPISVAKTIAGRPKLVLQLTADVPDSDVEALLYEIEAGGRSVLLGMDKMRLRYRNSLEVPQSMPAGKPVRIELPDFPFVARRLAVGSSLRLVVRAPASIYAEKNYNSGRDVGHETIADARVAHISISGTLALPMMGDTRP